MKTVKVERLFLFFLILISVFLYWSTADFVGIAQKTSAKYVKFIAFSMGVLCLFQLFVTYKGAQDQSTLSIIENKPHFLVLFIALILYAIAFPFVGFFLASAVFIPITIYGLGYRGWKSIVLVPLGFIMFVYLIFVKILSVNLPGFGF